MKILETWSKAGGEVFVLIYQEHNLLLIERWEGNDLIIRKSLFFKRDKEKFWKVLKSLKETYTLEHIYNYALWKEFSKEGSLHRLPSLEKNFKKIRGGDL